MLRLQYTPPTPALFPIRLEILRWSRMYSISVLKSPSLRQTTARLTYSPAPPTLSPTLLVIRRMSLVALYGGFELTAQSGISNTKVSISKSLSDYVFLFFIEMLLVMLFAFFVFTQLMVGIAKIAAYPPLLKFVARFYGNTVLRYTTWYTEAF